MPRALDERRTYSGQRLSQLKEELTEATAQAEGKACVYVTGSFGRLEACPHSDLDLFIAGRSEPDDAGAHTRYLSNLDEVCLKADLIRVVRSMKFPDFSGDGEYLKHYTVHDLKKALGTAADDASNAFTARLLLLLESRPLIGDELHQRAIDDVLAAYWRDFAKHPEDFLPAFLTNDILRLWRTFCVNYEARTQQEPVGKRNKRRLKNYKLRHSRVLTCYSALLYLMWIWRTNGTVRPEDAREMVRLTPTQRIETLRSDSPPAQLDEALYAVLVQYDAFLAFTNASEHELLGQVGNQDQWARLSDSAPEFAKSLYLALTVLGEGTTFHQMLVI